MRSRGGRNERGMGGELFFNNNYETFPVDRLLTYPSYKSFDLLIDLKHLRSLASFLKPRITVYHEQGRELRPNIWTNGDLI